MEKINLICNTCTIRLVEKAYKRSWWFKYIREPLKYSMIIASKIYRIDTNIYIVRTPDCYGCLRFLKVALKDKSRLFNILNRYINPIFDKKLSKLVTQDELKDAKEFAFNSTQKFNNKLKEIKYVKNNK